eukprot:ANDGO_08270.mRNA.1 hypothetical protein
MSTGVLPIALVRQVCVLPREASSFAELVSSPAVVRYLAVLQNVRMTGALLAVLPECVFNEWSPATQTRSPSDSNPLFLSVLCYLARTSGLALVSSVVRCESTPLPTLLASFAPSPRSHHEVISHTVADSERTFNVGVVVDATGSVVGAYEKMHLPNEPGFYEPYHWSPSSTSCLPPIFKIKVGADGSSLSFSAVSTDVNDESSGFICSVVLCSDLMRLDHCIPLRQRTDAIFHPRATSDSPDYVRRWLAVSQGSAIVRASFICSVSRPKSGILAAHLGGPSFVVDPIGNILECNTDQEITFCKLSAADVHSAKVDYPGYLAHNCQRS